MKQGIERKRAREGVGDWREALQRWGVATRDRKRGQEMRDRGGEAGTEQS